MIYMIYIYDIYIYVYVCCCFFFGGRGVLLQLVVFLPGIKNGAKRFLYKLISFQRV